MKPYVTTLSLNVDWVVDPEDYEGMTYEAIEASLRDEINDRFEEIDFTIEDSDIYELVSQIEEDLDNK